ncbi:hypothetical protein [Altererythrobacter sp. Root672]|uniref:hypothetical protein n=1 Tax=Altererythrobacter sp. Root672 TaxID=1736584 RepID=UPI0007011D75|nr:hypothetical protein [Altererythrobacter sp. Root672]KRA84495.1 hypothetical protein ASD76_11120 [Altererythrobacter sp. Root672]
MLPQPERPIDVQALYALPDHEVVAGLIPGIVEKRLRTDEAIERIRATPGMVPVAIDPESKPGGGAVLWADIGDHPFREWQFMYTIEKLAQSGQIGDAFSTDFAILQDDRILADPIEPDGFLFHISRCGSTLAAKALARSPRHVVINQGGPLQRGFWATITRDWTQPAEASPENLKAFRNLVLAMTRRRRPEQVHAFVKFISWNTLYLDFAMRAFPDVPALFLYRDPAEVIVSVLRETSAVLWAKGRRQAGFLMGGDWRATQDMGDVEYLAHCFAHYLDVAEQAPGRIVHVNYKDIDPASFPTILERGLNFKPDGAELALMLEQFRFHSKDDSDKQQFQLDSAEKRASMADEQKRLVSQICGELVARLDRSASNLFAREAKDL